MEKKEKYPEIDLVYLWVDGNDPLWRKKKAQFSKDKYSDIGMNSNARYIDNGELKYSLRSLEKYAPWIRKIFIVTDNQIPDWLDTDNPKIQIIDHTQILPQEAIPCFNSCVIEHNIHKIPGLSEYFLYANDDMFFNKPVSTEDFFTPEGLPLVRLSPRWFRKFWLAFQQKILKRSPGNYNLTIHTAVSLIQQKYGPYIGHKPHHNIDSYRKSQYAHTAQVFKNEIESTLKNHTRSDDDIQRCIYTFLPLAEKKAKARFVNQKESFRCHIEKPYHFDRLRKFNPKFFCLNDSQFADELSHKNVKEILQDKFPVKSSFEK